MQSYCKEKLDVGKMLTACDDGDPSATESTRRKAFNLDELPETKITDGCYCFYFILQSETD